MTTFSPCSTYALVAILMAAANKLATTCGGLAVTLAGEFGLALGHMPWRARYAPACAEAVGAPAFGSPRD